MSWQPIATAPKDGTDILIFRGGSMHVVFFDDEKQSPWAWCTADGISYHLNYPTHWRALPAPPEGPWEIPSTTDAAKEQP
jgi:hypothetical protein